MVFLEQVSENDFVYIREENDNGKKRTVHFDCNAVINSLQGVVSLMLQIRTVFYEKVVYLSLVLLSRGRFPVYEANFTF